MNEDDKSKSQAKRDAQALKDLGEQLATLSAKQFAQLPIPPELVEPLQATRKITSHLARKRHIQYLGALLRKQPEDVVVALQTAHRDLISSADVNSPRFRLIESWRERLLSDDADALTAFVAEYHCPQHSQALRQLIRKSKRELQRQDKSASSTVLFRLLRELVV